MQPAPSAFIRVRAALLCSAMKETVDGKYPSQNHFPRITAALLESCLRTMTFASSSLRDPRCVILLSYAKIGKHRSQKCFPRELPLRFQNPAHDAFRVLPAFFAQTLTRAYAAGFIQSCPKSTSIVLRTASPANYRRASGIPRHAARTQRNCTSARCVALLRHESNSGMASTLRKTASPANHRCTFGIMPTNNDFRVQLFAQPRRVTLLSYAQIGKHRTENLFSRQLPPRFQNPTRDAFCVLTAFFAQALTRAYAAGFTQSCPKRQASF